jgi:hypothetical protein
VLEYTVETDPDAVEKPPPGLSVPALPVKVGKGVTLGWTGYMEPVPVMTGDVLVSGHIVVYWLMVSVVVWP